MIGGRRNDRLRIDGLLLRHKLLAVLNVLFKAELEKCMMLLISSMR